MSSLCLGLYFTGGGKVKADSRSPLDEGRYWMMQTESDDPGKMISWGNELFAKPAHPRIGPVHHVSLLDQASQSYRLQ
jgi:hypothetical protein